MKLTWCVLAVLNLFLPVQEALAQATYPERAIRIIVGFVPGGPTDFAARVVGDKLNQRFGQPILIENVAGAGGNVATERVVRAAPNGYSLLLATNGTVVINPMLYQKLPFDPLKDLMPISVLCFAPNILTVPNSLAVHDPQQLAALARSEPGKHMYASAGVGTTQHLAGELFKYMAGIEITHVPYRGIAQFIPDLLAGRVSMAFGTISTVLPLAHENKLRAIAITSANRWPAMPELPTMAESGFPGFDVTIWFALMAPAGTPATIIDKLHQAIVDSLAEDDVRKQLDLAGMAVVANTPAEFAAQMRAERQQWADVIRFANIKAE
jgi:tripartite-type tricarboxylate transporter receptor subunit TctC